MKTTQYTVKIHKADEGGYWAEVPTLPGCFSQAETLEEIVTNIQEAIQVYIDSLYKDGQVLPIEEQGRNDFSISVIVKIPQLA